MRNPAFLLIALIMILWLSVGVVVAQEIGPTNIVVLVNRDGVNVRLFPELGAEVIGFVSAGFTAHVYARSPDNEWVKIRFAEEEGWIGMAVLNILEGDLNSAPVADPRTIPYGGFESPRAGVTSADSGIYGRLETNGVRVRSGPSRAYVVFANAPRRSEFPILGRTFNNAWFQINHEGTLGWVAARFVTLTDPFDVTTLPVDGIVAEGVIESQPTADDYFSLLRFMLARIEIAQASLDSSRAIWTNVALGGQASCAGFPAQPTDYNIPNPLHAAFFSDLDPIQRDFNDAMFNIRLSIDLLIDVCSRPQPQRGSVGQAAVIGALEAINMSDRLFISLRQRINDLLPPLLVVGEGQCLFTFADQSDVLYILQQSVIYLDRFTARRFINGYCFDAAAGQTVTISVLKADPTMALFMSVSPFDNPTNFIGVGQSVADQTLAVTTTIPADGRYLVIVTSAVDVGELAADESSTTLVGSYAVLAHDLGSGNIVDPANTVDLTGGAAGAFDITSLVPVVQVTPGFISPTTVFATSEAGSSDFCPGLNLTCSLLTCEQAVACLRAGNFNLDPDNDRIPCEENGCTLSADN